MGTRSTIARMTNKNGFSGVYHHWDGHPYSLGATLYKLYNGHFKKDIDAMLKFLIDDHPAGWSTINKADFTKPAGYNDDWDNRISRGPECYCHGDRSEKGHVITEETASSCGCEYAYVFKGKTMLVLSSYRGNGHKMIGMFGHGDPNAIWKQIGEVDLDGPEPDWDKME